MLLKIHSAIKLVEKSTLDVPAPFRLRLDVRPNINAVDAESDEKKRLATTKLGHVGYFFGYNLKPSMDQIVVFSKQMNGRRSNRRHP